MAPSVLAVGVADHQIDTAVAVDVQPPLGAVDGAEVGGGVAVLVAGVAGLGGTAESVGIEVVAIERCSGAVLSLRQPCAAAGGRMTETGLSLGTPYYMSPEQATADKDISARSDVYSLGSVLY